MTRDEALALLIAGVRHTRTEWDALPDDVRVALVEAGDHLRRHNAVLIAQAIAGDTAQVMAPADDGEQIVLNALAEALEAING